MKIIQNKYFRYRATIILLLTMFVIAFVLGMFFENNNKVLDRGKVIETVINRRIFTGEIKNINNNAIEITILNEEPRSFFITNKSIFIGSNSKVTIINDFKIGDKVIVTSNTSLEAERVRKIE